MLDLVEQGSSWEEILELGAAIEDAGITLINTGIGWHEAKIPTIATQVPRAAFTWVTKKFREHVRVPVITTNRINTPELAEEILSRGDADMVSMARPLLADPEFVLKASRGESHRINTCIACNQACLDHTFQGKAVSCLVNPRAGHETLLNLKPTRRPLKVVVVGAGPAGLSAALSARNSGHQVVLLDQAQELGGQFNLAKRIPGKEEFYETLRYFRVELERVGVEVRLQTLVDEDLLRKIRPDHVALATGVLPRRPEIPGVAHPRVLSYLDVLLQRKPVGERVAVLGAGGIGFDVTEFLLHGQPHEGAPKIEDFLRYWGIDPTLRARGAIEGIPRAPEVIRSTRRITLFQRKAGKFGRNLGKTTGWIHRSKLKIHGVETVGGIEYLKIDDQGLHYQKDGKELVREFDSIVLCTGQEPLRHLETALKNLKIPYTLLGGAKEASELDAKRAIREGFEWALSLET
jgi:2,4-dienoyl-CoA reductase (NADPH2)